MTLTSLTQVKGSVARALASIYTPRFSGLKAAMESTWAQLGVLYAFDIDGYQEGSTLGGGRFVLGTGRHNGGTFVDLSRSFPSDWNDQSQLATWFADSGSDVSGFNRVDFKYVTPEMFGSLSGQESGEQLNACFSSLYPVVLSANESYTSNRNLTIYRKVLGDNSSIEFLDSSFGLTVSEGVELGFGVEILGSRADLVNWGSNTVNSGKTTASGSQGYTVNSPNRTSQSILGADITSSSFPVLINQNATGGDFILSHSRITGTNGDAVEINTPYDAPFYNSIISSSILSGGVQGSGTTAGFSLGLAEGKNVVSVGNISKESRNEGYHVEDNSYGIVTVGNLFAGNLKDGSRILNKDNRKGSVHVGNSFIKERDTDKLTDAGSAWRTDIGYYVVWDANGTVVGDSITGNYVEGFDVAYQLGSSNVAVMAGNVAYDCNVALQVSRPCVITGDHLVIDCDTAFVGYGGSIAPHMSINDLQSCDIVKSSNSSTVGSVVKGFSGRTSTTTIASSYANAVICDLGADDRLHGILTITGQYGSTEGVFRVDEVTWDGSTLTVTNRLSKNKGAKSTSAPQVVSDQLVARIFSAAGGQVIPLNVTFDGILYSEQLV